jgi:putative transcriptional regulator
MRIRAGVSMPQHTHKGREMTLVLAGGFTDDTGHFLRGDLSLTDGTVDHVPTADDDGDCVCLAVTDAPLRLTGPIGRLFNPFIRF